LPRAFRGDAQHCELNRYAAVPARNRLCGNEESRTAPGHSAGEEAVSAPDVVGSPSGWTARVLAAKYRRKRRSYIVAVGHVGPTTPRWLSRRRWLEDLAIWAERDGAELLARRIKLSTFMTVAAALAQFCDSADGRHCAVTAATVARIAGCSERTVSTMRSILAASGFAILAQQGCGGAGRANRVPVWHLVSRREPVDNTVVCDLPPSRRDRGLPPVTKKSPTRPRVKKSPPKAKNRRYRSAADPRPLPLQRLAAAVVHQTSGLAGGHIGAICDALTAAGIDPATTTAEQICHHITEDNRKKGWVWPQEIQRPGGFLTYRLRRIADRIAPQQRPTAVAPIRRHRNPRQDESIAPPVIVVHRPGRADGECAVCGAVDSPRRPYLPSSRASICDRCWTVARLQLEKDQFHGRDDPGRAVHADIAGAGL